TSQNWVPGSQEYKRQRAIAVREEVRFHFFSQSPPKNSHSSKHKARLLLQGYRSLYSEAQIPNPADYSVAECKLAIKAKLVNIVDLIDVCRTGGEKKVKVWKSFKKFSAYTLEQPGKTFNWREATKPPGILASLLHRLLDPDGEAKWKENRERQRRLDLNKVIGGRISKR
ncbi:hypothetical protein QBC38DRAFT_387911, partial [Podospora fimiseda]